MLCSCACRTWEQEIDIAGGGARRRRRRHAPRAVTIGAMPPLASSLALVIFGLVVGMYMARSLSAPFECRAVPVPGLSARPTVAPELRVPSAAPPAVTPTAAPPAAPPATSRPPVITCGSSAARLAYSGVLGEVVLRTRQPLRAPSRFSSHKCVGGSDYNSGVVHLGRPELDWSKARTCIFHDVCHAADGGEGIIYYVNSSEPRQPMLADSNAFIFDFPPDFLLAGPYNHFSPSFAPSIALHPMPLGAIYHGVNVSVAFHPHVESSFAEFVNVMSSLFMLPALHGFQPAPETVQMLELDGWVTSKPMRKFRAALLPALTAHEPAFLRDLGPVCFANLIVGSGSISVLDMGLFGSLLIEPMRDVLLDHLGILSAPVVTHRVLVIEKSATSSNSGRHISNHDELVAHLTHHLAGIAHVEGFLPDTASIGEQAGKAHAATVIIAPPGSGSFIGLFAQPGAALVFLDVNADGNSVRYPQETTGGREDAFWTHLRTVEVLHYPVCSIEETQLSRTDTNTTPSVDTLDIIVRLPRMEHVVYLAMKLAERHFPDIRVRDGRRDGAHAEADICSL